ncbi:MAG: sigma factor-like helix-turn-helix DNA-binding protein [Patescibacteria group bacterium]|jgi:hypothetical protein
MDTETKTTNINFNEVLTRLFSLLSIREKDVLSRRHSLLKGLKRKETLEKIGQDYKVTRERVRQIERDGLKKMKEKLEQSGVLDNLNEIEATINKFLRKYGGAMQEDRLLDSLVDFYGLSSKDLAEEEVLQHKKSLAFIISQLLANKFEKIENRDHFHDSWKLKETPWELVEEVIEKLVALINTNGQPVKVDEFFRLLKNQDFYRELSEKISNLPEMKQTGLDLDEAVSSYIHTSKRIKKNLFGQVGMSHWSSITPKRMADKIYLVMKEAGKPLHFTEIAELINQTKFDHKKALPATIHNELILDSRYVLIGRGIYALKEWGYETGTVTEVIAKVLAQKSPLSKDEIAVEVAKQRLVKKATINLALMNKDKFKKLADKKYTLANKE